MSADSLVWTQEVTPAVTQEQAATVPRKRTWRRFLRGILMYVGIYVLMSGISIGPLFWVWFGAAYVDGPKWIVRAYLPLELLCKFFPPLDWLVNAWINWWIL